MTGKRKSVRGPTKFVRTWTRIRAPSKHVFRKPENVFPRRKIATTETSATKTGATGKPHNALTAPTLRACRRTNAQSATACGRPENASAKFPNLPRTARRLVISAQTPHAIQRPENAYWRPSRVRRCRAKTLYANRPREDARIRTDHVAIKRCAMLIAINACRPNSSSRITAVRVTIRPPEER